MISPMILLMPSMRCNHDHAIDNIDDIDTIIFNNINTINIINIFNMIGYHRFHMSISSILFVNIMDDIDTDLRIR